MLALTVALAGCARYAGNPTDGFGPFIAETHTTNRADDQAASPLESLRRAQGYAVAVDPLLPEIGNVWPGPIPIDKSLGDIQREQNDEQQQIDQSAPGPNAPPGPWGHNPHGGGTPAGPWGHNPHGSSTPPGSVQTTPIPVEPHTELAPPSGWGIPVAPPQSPAQALTTPQGPLIQNPANGGGIGTGVVPGGVPGQSILVPNGNGTTTVIGPDGNTQVVPSAR